MLITIFLVAAWLRLNDLGAQSVWFDEGWSAYAATQPTLWDAALADTTNPPLYYVLINLSASMLGDSEFALRWLSFAFGMLVVALVGRLGHDTLPGAATWAVLLAGVNLPLVWASQEMRMYTLLAVLTVTIVIAWNRIRQLDDWLAWGLLLLGELAVLYTHNTGPVVIIWVNLVTLFAWMIERRPILWKWLIGQALVAVLWLPYFLSRFLLLSDANAALVRRTGFDLRLWNTFWFAPWEGLSDLSAFPLALTVIPFALLLLSARSTPARWIVAHTTLLVIGIWAALGLLGNEVHGRYMVMVAPLMIVAVAVSLSMLPRLVGGVAGLALLLMTFVGYRTLYAPANLHDDARAMAAHYAATLDADDTVLAWSYADRYELAYYWDRMAVAANRVTLPEGATMQEILPLLPRQGDVSVNVWYTQRADYRGMLECLLAHGAAGPPQVFEVNGMATRTYHQPMLQAPTTRPLDDVFSVGSLKAVGQLPDTFSADQSVCVPVTLQLTRSTPAELQVALVVENDLGVEIASTSSVFATANGRTSVDGTVGESLRAFPVMRLTAGTPPGGYTVKLRVFDEVAISGYDLLQNGTPVGKDIFLDEWRVQSGAAWPVSSVDTLTLADDHLPDRPVRNGETVRFALIWQVPPATQALPTVDVRGVDADWAVRIPSNLTDFDNLVTEWRTVRIPPDAPSGEAVLSAAGIGEIGRVQIERIPVSFAIPENMEPVGAFFGDIGTLMGYRVLSLSTESVAIELVWQAAQNPDPASKTVFVQLLADDGTVVAQSDSVPAGGARPVETWRAGEIITDRHQLQFNVLPPDEPLRLIAGLYDETGRVMLEDQADFAELSLDVILE